LTAFKLSPIALACAVMAVALPAQSQTTEGAAAGAQVIEVTGMRRSLQRTEEIKREASQVVDSINASDIGAFPDNSIGESCSALPACRSRGTWVKSPT
jgi:hypothetical protein